jgi:hypothetical protein
MNYYDPQFYGTENYYKTNYGFVYTDSIKDFCRKYEAYWILDLIESYYPKLRKEDFCSVYIDVDDNTAEFYVTDGNSKRKIVKQSIEFTDLSVSIHLYLTDNVLMFPSDY